MPRLLLPLLLGPTFGSFEELGTRHDTYHKGAKVEIQNMGINLHKKLRMDVNLIMHLSCCNLSLGLATKAKRGLQGCGPRGSM
jgi:hypothetical protein